MECVKCKKSIPVDAVFCPYCGRRQIQERRHKKRANGTGTISKLSGNRAKPWAARKNDVYIGSYKTRAEAQKALDNLSSVDVTDLFHLTFTEVYEAMLPELRDVTPEHLSNLRGRYRACSALHDKIYRKIRRSEFMAEIIRLEQEGKSKSTVQKTLQLFHHMEAWAIGEGIVQASRVEKLNTIAKQKSVKRILTDTEIDKIKKSGHRAAQIVLIILGAGCRTNEIFKVKTEDCFEDYFIGGSKTKAGERRTIMISEVGLPSYQALRNEAIANGCEYLIKAYSGNSNQRNFVKRDLADLFSELNITGVTLHDLRHTMVTQALESGVDHLALTQMIGHTDIETTKIYTHMRPEHLRKEIQKISKPEK